MYRYKIMGRFIITNSSENVTSGTGIFYGNHGARYMLMCFTILITFNCFMVTTGSGSSIDTILVESNVDDGDNFGVWSSQTRHNNMELTKRNNWNKMQSAWGGGGKRGWQNLHSTGWGKRTSPFTSSIGSGNSEPYLAIIAEIPKDKRAWQNLQAGWGKRNSPPSSQYNEENESDKQIYVKRKQDYNVLYVDDDDSSLQPLKRQLPAAPKRQSSWSNLKYVWG